MPRLDVIGAGAQPFELDSVVSIVGPENILHSFRDVRTFRKVRESYFAFFFLAKLGQHRIVVQKPKMIEKFENSFLWAINKPFWMDFFKMINYNWNMKIVNLNQDVKDEIINFTTQGLCRIRERPSRQRTRHSFRPERE